jgi:hypothetical protein
VTGVGADLIGLRGATFFPLFTGRGGGGITSRRSSTTGAATGATTVATETVCDFSSTVRVGFPDFDGNGRPGALFFTGVFTGAFFAATFLAGAFFAIFFAGAFLATFFTGLAAAFLAGAFLAGAFFAAFAGFAGFAAFLTTFFADTPRTLCAFSTSTKYATRC